MMLGGSVEFLADQELRCRASTRLSNSEAYEAAWPANLERLEKQVAAERPRSRAAAVGRDRHRAHGRGVSTTSCAVGPGRQGDPRGDSVHRREDD